MASTNEALIKLIYKEENDKAIADARKQLAALSSEEKSSLQKSKMSLTDLKSGIDLASQAISKLKQGWDFAKEGAQIQYTRDAFDKLTASMGGSTSVLAELQKVTKGTRSDMELIGSASDFMKLGLAKSREEVVRLTRVAGALNMDMNQLVLTLANKTTMRFDQLGVSVDGFDARVKELEKSGLDVNKAFTQAFLEQAEKQIERVGDAADTTAGKMARLEAKFNNFIDSAKTGAASTLGRAIDDFDHFGRTISGQVSEVESLTREYERLQKQGLSPTSQYMVDLQAKIKAINSQYNVFATLTNAVSFAQQQQAQRTADAASAQQQHTAIMQSYSNELLYSVQKYQEQQVAAEAAAKAQATYRAGIAESTAQVGAFAQKLAEATDAQAKQMLAQSSLDALKKAYEEGSLSQDGFARATDAVMLRYDLATPKSLAMAKAQDDVVKAFLAGEIPLQKFIAAGDSIPQMAEDGVVSLAELKSLGVEPTTSAVNSQRDAVYQLRDAWAQVPRDVTTNYSVNGGNGGAPATAPAAPGGGSGGGGRGSGRGDTTTQMGANGAVGSSGAGIVINVNGAGDPYAVAMAVADILGRRADNRSRVA